MRVLEVVYLGYAQVYLIFLSGLVNLKSNCLDNPVFKNYYFKVVESLKPLIEPYLKKECFIFRNSKQSIQPNKLIGCHFFKMLQKEKSVLTKCGLL